MKGKFKLKTGTVAIYVLALMLVTVGYWNYISKESQTLETVASNQEEQNNEKLGDAQLVSNNELIEEEEQKSEELEKDVQQNSNNSETHNNTEATSSKTSDEYFETSKLSRDTMYSQTLETYKDMLNNSNVSEEQKAIVTQEITKLNKEKNAIMMLRKLLA